MKTIIPALDNTQYPRPHASGLFTLGAQGYVFDVTVYPNLDDRKRYLAPKTRGMIHVCTTDGVDKLWGIDGHPPYGQRGDNPAHDAQWDAFNKLEVETQRQLIDAALPVLFPGIERVLIGRKQFSRKAGCSCGCSPGWKMYEDLTEATSLPWVYFHSTRRVPVVLSFDFALLGEVAEWPKQEVAA